jgi:hypothetical protein
MRNTLLLLAVTLSLIFFGCKKEKVVKATNINNAQAAYMVSTALSINANGFATIKNDIVIYAKALVSAGKGCGVVDSFAVARQETAASTINYNYALGYYYTVNCNNTVADNLTSHIVYNGSFDASNLAEVNKISSDMNLSALSGTGTTYSLNGNYQSDGTFNTYDETQLSGNNDINIDIKDMVITKANRNIVSGTANVSVSGTVKNKNSFMYNGTVVFNGASSATLTLEGVSYSVNLITAEITAL